MRDSLTAIGALACLAMVLTGCATPVYYVPPAGESSTLVRLQGQGMPLICENGKWKDLRTEGQNLDRTMQIPAGRRVTVRVAQALGTGNGTLHCNSTVSLVPAKGVPLTMYAQFKANRCEIEVVRDAPSSPTGILLEPTLDRPSC